MTSVLDILQPTTGRTAFAATMTDAPPRISKAAVAWHALPQDVLDGGEIVILAIKPSMCRPLLDSWPWILTAGVLAVLTTAWHATIPGLSIIATAQVILLVAACRLAVAVVRWIPTWYVLTNRRVLTVHGVRAPRFTAFRLTDVGHTYLRCTPFERLTRVGTVILVSKSNESMVQVWRSIAHSAEVHARIRRAIEDVLDPTGSR